VELDGERHDPRRRERALALNELDDLGAHRRGLPRLEAVEERCDVVVDHRAEGLDPARGLAEDVRRVVFERGPGRIVGDGRPPGLGEPGLEPVASVAEPLLVVLADRLLERVRDPEQPPLGVPQLGGHARCGEALDDALELGGESNRGHGASQVTLVAACGRTLPPEEPNAGSRPQ
jgi:hypothetical protein